MEAFKCDSCGKFFEGKNSDASWLSSVTIHNMSIRAGHNSIDDAYVKHFCSKDCAKAFFAMVVDDR